METVIMSLGGSLIVPNEIDVNYLKKFKTFIKKHLRSYRFIIVPGGGRTARRYMKAAKALGGSIVDQDWTGIASVDCNAELLRILFNAPVVTVNEKIPVKPVVIVTGAGPGHSSDYDAVYVAKKLKAECIINVTNQDFVYDKDPAKYKTAKPLQELTWAQYKKIIGGKWQSSMHVPFDPVASKLATKLNFAVANVHGKKLSNLHNLLAHKPFKGTIIR